MKNGSLVQPKTSPLLPVTTLLTHQPSQIAIMPRLTNRHTPRNSNIVEIDEALPKAEKMRMAPRKTAAKNQANASKEYRILFTMVPISLCTSQTLARFAKCLHQSATNDGMGEWCWWPGLLCCRCTILTAAATCQFGAGPGFELPGRAYLCPLIGATITRYQSLPLIQTGGQARLHD